MDVQPCPKPGLNYYHAMIFHADIHERARLTNQDVTKQRRTMHISKLHFNAKGHAYPITPAQAAVRMRRCSYHASSSELALATASMPPHVERSFDPAPDGKKLKLGLLVQPTANYPGAMEGFPNEQE